ncbi:MAG: sigma 54-interacting transcriptional regulator [Azoarcus sp.]|nr:sigma 54-interacting transcriptional regulator [Azoarcus sp.]
MNNATPPASPSADLNASWSRSRGHGLQTDQPLPDGLHARADLNDRLEANARLLTFSQPVIENLYRQIDSPASTVLLTDSQGLILSAIGDNGFLDRAARVALSPGAEWSEAIMGTNAIGTALVSSDIVAIQGTEHFLERNRFLTCVATPIFAPTGGIAGVLDISTDARANLSHANALLRTTAECIEHRLIESLDEGFLTIRFHPRAELIGSPLEGLTVFDEGGRLLACNRAARALLKLFGEYPDASCDECFGTEWQRLVDWAALSQPTPFPLRTNQGRTCVARASLRQSPVRRSHLPAPAAPAPTPAHRSPLDAFNLGDPHISSALKTLAQWHDETGPLLIEGETGTGKRHLVLAYHQSLLTTTALISLDCTALAASPALQVETDHALHQASGGILYLIDCDALPLAEQSRLFSTASRRTRIIAATRRPLATLHREQALATSTFEACGGRSIHLPALRERTDFDALVRRFVRSASPDQAIYVCPDALALLRRHTWPGNLSELNNRLRLILALMGDNAGQLCPEDIPEELLEQVTD